MFVEIKGGTCLGNNPEGLHVKVLDNNIWKRLPLGGRDGTYEGTSDAPGAAVVKPGGALGGTSGNLTGGAHGPAGGASGAPAGGLPVGNTPAVPAPTVNPVQSAKIPSPIVPQNNAVVDTAQDGKAKSAVPLPNTAPETVIMPSINAGPILAEKSTTTTESDPAKGVGNPAGSSGNCVVGKWACSGNKLQLCSYTTSSTPG